MGSKSNQCKDNMTKLENRAAARDQLLRDVLKTTKEHEEWFQLLLDDAKKMNLRLTGNSEKPKHGTNGILKTYMQK